ncbi:MAG: hypothetical protein RBS80_24280 [Thermoguttaceae bacterium]|jgi:hypothetical protein|nr:hypothetical protein [Thermoguttaceae bacterium]
MMNASATGAADPPRPFFIPAGVQFDELPQDLQAAITAVVNPAYQKLVLEARDGLEKSSGLTVAYLVWLEILDQLEMAKSMPNVPTPEASAERDKLIARHLRLIGAKSKASNFLLRIKEFRRKWGPGLAPLERFPVADNPSDEHLKDQTGG